MANSRVATWNQTHDLGAALGLDASRIPVRYRQALENMLETMPPEQMEGVLDSLNGDLADQAFGDQQFADAFAKVAGQVSLVPPSQAPSTPVSQQTAQLLGTPPQPSAYTASQQQATGATAPTAPGGTPQAPPSAYSAAQPPGAGTLMPSTGPGAGGPTSGQSNLTVLAAYLGTTPEQVQQQYQGYVTQFWQHTRAGSTFSGEDVSPLAIGDWVESSLTALEGRNSLVLNAYEAYYEQVYGTPMPGDLRASLRQQLQNLPPNSQGMLDQAIATLSTPVAGGGATITTTTPAPTAAAGAAGATTTTAPAATQPLAQPTPAQASADLKIGTTSSQLPFLDQAINDYTAAHQSPAQLEDAVMKQRVSYYYSAFNRMPDQATQQQLQAMTDPQFQQMINNTYTYYNTFGQMPDASMQQQLAGMSQTQMTAWQKNVTTLSQAWMDNFGKMPTDQQMTAASTMNADQLTEYINNSPSRITGMNIGQFTGYKQALDPIYTKEFGHSAPDELVQYFSEAQKGA